MPDRFDSVYRVKRANGQPEALTEEFFNIRFRDVDLRVSALELLEISWQAALLQVRGEVLDRSEQVITDLRDKLVSLTQLQWLTALSGTSRTLVVDDLISFAVDTDYRDLFTPGPFVLLSRAATPDDYAVARTSAYDRVSGQLNVEILTVTGNAGPHSDWVISAIAGSTLAQLELLNQAKALEAAYLTARDAAIAAAMSAADDASATAGDRSQVNTDKGLTAGYRDAALAARDLAQKWATQTLAEVVAGQGFGAKKYAVDSATSASAAAASAASISGGPVTSVAGLTGVVSTVNLKSALGIATDISTAINALLGGAPAALDTLKELADAINDDASYAASITAALALKAPLASPTLTGTPTAPTPATADNTSRIATTAMVQAAIAAALPSNGKIAGLAYGDSIGF